MIKKTILYLALLFAAFFLYSNEDNKLKFFEFNIGGAMNHYGFFTVEYTKNEVYYTIADNESQIGLYPTVRAYDKEYVIKPEMAGQGFIFLLPLTFVYFPYNIYGIGISSELGFGFNLIKGYLPYYFDIYYNLRLVNKFGKAERKHFFYTEIGLDVVSRIEIESSSEKYGEKYVNYNSIYNFIFLGPGINLSYQRIFNNNFSIITGATISILFYYNNKDADYSGFPDDPDDKYYGSYVYSKIEESFDTVFRFGVEVRLLYSFFKKIEND